MICRLNGTLLRTKRNAGKSKQEYKLSHSEHGNVDSRHKVTFTSLSILTPL